MRTLLLLLVPVLASCAASDTNAPSLFPRPAEAIDPRVPVPDPVLSATPTPGLVAQLNSLVAQAEQGDAAFRPLADHAAQLAQAAGPKESEGWIAAQQALSAAIAARAPVATAIGDIDTLGAQRVQKLGGIGAADLKAIDAAAARVADIDSREAGLIQQIQSRLGR
jgi:hypothetical protein